MSAAQAPFISRRPKDFGPYSFWALRGQGLTAVQALTGARWTDYNLHDPGVTILEQACYALTELVYRADARVADHLADARGRIAFEALALHPAESVFPCRPTTAADYRHMLLDRLEELADAKLAPAADTRPAGTWDVELRVAATRQHRRDDVLRDAMTLLRSQRNLGEDFEHDPLAVKEHTCEITGKIEIGGPYDPADVLAAIYAYCAHVIEAPAQFSSLATLQEEGLRLEDIFDGPPVEHGVLREIDSEDPAQPVFVAELVTGIQTIPGVVQVKDLALVKAGDAHHRSELDRRGPGWALRLALPRDGGHDELLTLMRRGTTLKPPMTAVRRKYAERRVAMRQSQRQADPTGFAPPRPAAGRLIEQPFCTMQDQFPAVYGINSFGLPSGASARERSSALQMRAYLALFDQMLAHSTAQLAHIRELFTVDPGVRKTYWWQMLEERAIPGAAGRMYDTPPAEIEHRVYRPTDDFIERKGRLLDHLLALHGETYSQNSLRQFGGYYTARELKNLLFENKLAFLKEIIALGRDRAAAFDDTLPAWDAEGNTSGLQRRVALLLGFGDSRTRALTAAITRRKRDVARKHEDDTTGTQPPPEGAVRLELLGESYRPTREEANRDLSAIGALSHTHIDEALLHCGAHSERYWIAEHDGGHVLYCGPQGKRWFSLGRFADRDAASRAATTMRRFLLRLNEESEGLHVLEHVLLAPVGSSARHELLRQELSRQEPPVKLDFSRPTVSVVFPAWVQRFSDPNFRALAVDTVQVNCPAHLSPRCLGLEFGAMREFEEHYRKWLDARRKWLSSESEERLRVEMNHLAAALLRALLTTPEWEVSP